MCKIKKRFNDIKYRHKKKNFNENEFISFEFFLIMINKNCFYCNKKNNKKIIFGLDRINSNIGYINSNVVTCCKKCNYAKNKLSISKFYILVKFMFEKNNKTFVINKENIYKNDESMFLNKYNKLKKRNKKKFGNITNIITFKQFKEKAQQKCKYCDTYYNYQNIRTKTLLNGLDRIDSSKHYSFDNTVSACYYCNVAKSTMSTIEFKNHMKSIYRNQLLKSKTINKICINDKNINNNDIKK